MRLHPLRGIACDTLLATARPLPKGAFHVTHPLSVCGLGKATQQFAFVFIHTFPLIQLTVHHALVDMLPIFDIFAC